MSYNRLLLLILFGNIICQYYLSKVRVVSKYTIFLVFSFSFFSLGFTKKNVVVVVFFKYNSRMADLRTS